MFDVHLFFCEARYELADKSLKWNRPLYYLGILFDKSIGITHQGLTIATFTTSLTAHFVELNHSFTIISFILVSFLLYYPLSYVVKYKIHFADPYV